jgi:mannose-1-phosphate guanylyltransferase
MAKDGQLHSMELEGFWMDVGQPKDYLTGTGLYLASLGRKQSDLLSKHSSVVGNVIIHPTAKIGEGCKIGPNVIIGPNVVVGDGARITKSVIMEGTHYYRPL